MANTRTLTPSFEEMRQQFLRDVRLAAVDTGMTAVPPTSPGSDWYLLATACSGIGMTAITNVQISDEDQNILTATGDALEAIRIGDGLDPVVPIGASGAVVIQVLGSTVIAEGTRLVSAAGLQYQVVGNYTYTAATLDTEINVRALDVGTKTNLAAGEIIRFSPAPPNVQLETKVSAVLPLTGGVDAEDDERKRARILNARRNRPAGGNWGQLRQIATDAAAGVQDCYVYPALGGPATAKVVPVRKFDRTALSWSRVCSPSLLQTVRQKIWAKVPVPDRIVIQAAEDQPIDTTIQVTIPDSALSGGSGQGWTDSTVWPQLVVGDSGKVTVTTAYGSAYRIVVSAGTATSPIAGQTTIAWWSSADMKFYKALVLTVAGSAGAWDLTLDRALVSSRGVRVAVGDYICPDALHLNDYGKTWIDYLETLGPAENTTDSGRLPTAKRRPFVTDEDPTSITNVSFAAFRNNSPEITDISYGYQSATTPTVPGSADTAPNVLTPRRFAVYVK